MFILPKEMYRVKVIHIKSPAGFFAEIDKLILEFIWRGAWLVQSLENVTLCLGVMSSSPMLGVEIT